jgi:RNA polymerase sigma factor (sigma-70 family)
MPIFEANRALLDRFRRGDREALATVYHRYVDEVATLARRGFTIESSGHAYVRGADRDGERELVQETFAKAFSEKARTAYDGVSPYRPYLLRITKNLMIDRFRADQRNVRSVELDTMGVGDIEAILTTNADFPQKEETPDLHWKTLLVAANEYVTTLDAESRQLVTLRFEEELSQDDVASRLGCTRRRVRTVEERIQQGLRKWLQQRGLLSS